MRYRYDREGGDISREISTPRRNLETILLRHVIEIIDNHFLRVLVDLAAQVFEQGAREEGLAGIIEQLDMLQSFLDLVHGIYVQLLVIVHKVGEIV